MANDTGIIIAATAGIALAYAGVTGKSPLGVVRGVITGKSPQSLPATEPIAQSSGLIGQVSAGTPYSGGPVTGQVIASDALQYQGHPYLYGGASGPDGSGSWDCSSFVSYVLGHDFGIPIPGGSWAQVTGNGSNHGPTTLSYLAWGGAKTVPYSQAQPGDLAVWQTHMGIFISSTEMISAEDAQLGTGISQVQGAIPGEILVVRRLKIVSQPIPYNVTPPNAG